MPSLIVLVLAGPAAFAAGAMVLWAAPGLLGTATSRFRVVVAVLAGAVALALPPSPTGLTVVDAVLRAALAAVVTLVASRARSRAVLASVLLAASSAWGSPLHVLALAAAGVMVALTLTSARRSLAGIVVAAASVVVALQLEWPRSPHGATAVAAVVVVAPLVVSGTLRARSRAGRREQRLVGRFAAAVVLLGAAFGMLGVLAVLAARPSLEQAVSQAKSGLALARRPDPVAARVRLEGARRSFEAAHGWLDAWWVRPGWAVPVLGQHLRALRSVSAAGVDLADAGTNVASAASLEGLTISDGQLPVERIAAVGPAVGDAFDALDAAVDALRRADSPWLLPSFDRRLDGEVQRLVDARASARRTHEALRVLPALLGASGPRRYFLLVQTPSELRGTGGFMGNFGEITAVGGKLSLERFGRTHELNPTTAAAAAARTISGPPDYVARYRRFAPATTWQNVTMSPDFPSVAKVVGELYPQSGGRAVDGVLALDPAGLAALLRLTGPVDVAGWPEPLTAANAERVLLHDQYVRFGDGDTGDRVDFLGDAARVVWSRLTAGTLPALDQVARALGPAVAQKRIMFASLRPLESDVVSSLGVSGTMAPVGRSDFLGVVAQNASASKIDWYLRRSIDYSVAVGRRGSVSATATIRLRNEAPSSGLPSVVIGSATTPPLPMGTSRLYVSVYSPWALASASIGGTAVNLESERELGRNVYSTFVDVGAGSTATLVVRLTGSYDTSAGSRYALTVHRQPVVAADDVRIDSTVVGGGAAVRRTLRLVEDERVEGSRVAAGG